MLDLTTVRSRIEAIAERDPGFEVFGSESHRYQLLPPLSDESVGDLEEQLGMPLPGDYRDFVTTVAEGGAGPGFGLEPLSKSVASATTSYPPEVNLAVKPFNITRPLIGPDELDTHEGRVAYGVISLATYGCGIDPHLVVNGPDFGKVWVLDVDSDGGVYPFTIKESGHLHTPRRDFPTTIEEMVFNERMSFAEWYEDWLVTTEELTA